MQFGINIANLATYSDPRLLAELAHEAEESGWDGFFVWDMLLFDRGAPVAVADAWIALAAAAVRTRRIRLGPMVTGLPQRRPWKVAREAVTLDHLSQGRLILGVGVGFQPAADAGPFGAPTDDRTRAAMLDEALDIITGLWTGQPFRYAGQHYHITEEVTFLPVPVQQPRIPIWLTGIWPHQRPFRRAARWDGVYPSVGDGWISPDEIRALAAYVQEQRPTESPFPFAIAHLNQTPGDDPAQAAALVAPYQAAGVTWWMENLDPWRGPLDAMRRRIQQGPPRLRGE